MLFAQCYGDKMINKLLKYSLLFIGLMFVLCPPKDSLIDERIFGLLLIWMMIDITR